MSGSLPHSTELSFSSFPDYDGRLTSDEPPMRDVGEQRKQKIRISTWALALLTLSLYGGFIILAMITNSGAAG